ncbi:MAG: DctP family TRAP transporter solute-binding subunit [Treponemataceae bacterium]
MKRLFALALIAAVAFSPVFAGGQGDTAKKDSGSTEYPSLVLKLGHIGDPGHPYSKGAEYFAELVNKKSNGKIVIKTYHSSQLGDQKTLIEGLMYGTIDMALVGTAALGQFQPQISLFDLPFLFNDLPHAYAALDTVGMDLGKPLEAKGIKLLGYMENGIRHMTNNVRPIKSPADMKGLKIRVQTNKIHVAMIKDMGGSPTPMAMGELYTALQQGAVDGQENPAAHIFTQRYYEVQKYASRTAHVYSPEPVLISMAKWNAFPQNVKDLFLSSAKEAIAWQRKLSSDEDEGLWDKIKATGKMEVIDVDRQPFVDATAGLYEQFAASVGKDNITKIKALAKK